MGFGDRVLGGNRIGLTDERRSMEGNLHSPIGVVTHLDAQFVEAPGNRYPGEGARRRIRVVGAGHTVETD